ncbi:hypothetical protein [Brevundimonas sp.]|jgi:hypothetical protein|uniref:hypothetical protein n=1 Tax=Brevundimonas sp. TaxID=1871086 RepID=UPI0037BF42D4
MTHQDPQSETPQDVRQGRPGTRILWLLIISAGAAVVLLTALWLFSQDSLSKTDPTLGEQAANAQAFQGDGQTPPAADAPTGPTGEPQPTPTGETPNVNAPTTPSN